MTNWLENTFYLVNFLRTELSVPNFLRKINFWIPETYILHILNCTSPLRGLNFAQPTWKTLSYSLTVPRQRELLTLPARRMHVNPATHTRATAVKTSEWSVLKCLRGEEGLADRSVSWRRARDRRVCACLQVCRYVRFWR